ncbi:MAG: MFS transporter [Bacteroidota bacterium]|jgi:ACS family hexuronate transporter-like MFS transporter
MDQTEKMSNHRWKICALLFFATTINYMDRQILGLLAPILQKEIGWSEIEYGWIVTAFQAAYALGLLAFGWFIDKFGTKIGYTVSITGWSIAAMAHAAVTSVIGFGAARFGLGLSEAGNFPSAQKATAEWFPKKERALTTGIYNSGANIGAVLAPAVVPWLTVTYGWQEAFIVVGALGFIWIIFWMMMYDKPENMKGVNALELAHIQSDPPEPTTEKIPWAKLLTYKQTWAFMIGKFLTDPIWWFYLYWLPKYLNTEYGLSITDLGLPLIAIYTMTSVGSIGGGWLSSRLIKKGWTINKARKTTMLVAALLVLSIIVASQVTDLWISVILIGIAAAAHQGWSANIFTTASDMFPKRAVGSVTGLGGMAGSVGGLIFAPFIGYMLEWTGSYFVPFIISGTAYLLALGIMHIIVPNLEQAEV